MVTLATDNKTQLSGADVQTQEIFPAFSDNFEDDADRKLAEMGYTPVFKREFSRWSSFSFAMSVSGLYGSLMATWLYALRAGGAGALTWSWVLGGFGSWVLALSIAEIASAYPTSGGMYFSLKYLVPERYIPFLSWVNGYLNLVGMVSGTASGEYATAQMLLSSISMASGFSYVPTSNQVIGTMAALMVLHGLVNSLSTAWLNRLTKGYAGLHIGVLIAACVTLLVMQKDKHSAKYVFTHFEPAMSGWSPAGFAFLFGCLTPAWIMTNCDSAAHIAEEAKDPSRVVPAAIFSASTFTYVVGFLFNLVLIFCMGDPAQLINAPSGQPVTQLFYNVMGPGLSVFFTLVAFVVMNCSVVAAVQSASRTIWSFARDGMLPVSHIWYRIDKTTQTPLHAVWLYVVLCIGLNLIGLASQTAISAVFNVCAIALNISYVIPIACKLLYGRFERGPWNLGRLSAPVNMLAIVWNVLMSVIFVLPVTLPVTPENMNYAVVVLVVVLLFCIGYWQYAGKHYYTGPRTHAHPPGASLSAIQQGPLILASPATDSAIVLSA